MEPLEALRGFFSQHVINLCYLLAATLFILGIKGLTHPRTAVRGNLLAALGMLIAVLVTLLDRQIVSFGLIIAGLAVGGLVGVVIAARIEMTAMPQLVALFNGFGGAASILVASAALGQAVGGEVDPALQTVVAASASALIGAVTFTGSLVAFGKLQGIINSGNIVFPGQKILNAILFIAAIALSVKISMDPGAMWAYALLCVLALALGVLLTIPIGGADMPVVIALLNSYSGLAASATGFVLNNNMLIIAGSLVGASGIILTRIMCKAMNRSLTHVLFGVMGPTAETASADEVYAGKIKATSPEELAMIFETARYVIIVPGYGMAVAQAQHAVREMAGILEERGVKVEYAIHPVAGRMPGHMNVLLAEADVPYDQLKTLEEINSSFKEADVAIVIGANDVVNPLAKTDPTSPIAGMPILNVDEARTAVVVKRSLSPGFAGIPNPLFAADNCLMLFGDGKKAITELNAALKEG